jgi:ferredoxin
MKQFDERDIMFSRLGLIQGTDKYNQYYEAHPDLKDEDDRLRKITQKKVAKNLGIDLGKMKKMQLHMAMLQKFSDIACHLTGKKILLGAGKLTFAGGGGADDDVVRSAISKPALKMARLMNTEAGKSKVSPKRMDLDPREITAVIKALAIDYGADLVGIARLKKHHLYSHRGDHFGVGADYGEPIRVYFPFAIVVAAALDKDMINRAPKGEAKIACMLGYAKSTAATTQLAQYIKSLGYDALTDNHLEYYSPMTPLAADAGLGQIGRCNMVVNKVYGNRLKIGAVLTTLPLLPDGPVDLGMKDFCAECMKCAKNCPSKAISVEEPQEFNGLMQWEHKAGNCIEMWMKTGTAW